MTALTESSFYINNNQQKNLVSNPVLGMCLFVFTEVMFFAALLSAYIVIKGNRDSWEIPSHIRLPVLSTAYNSLILILSGVLLYYVHQLVVQKKPLPQQKQYLGLVMVLGGFFVAFQGYEWVQLLAFGLSMSSSIFGALFFLLIGCHGVHAVAGIVALSYLYSKSTNQIDLEHLKAVEIFWFFVVGVWPFLYVLVYF